jgi:glycosyltransferase involved in cell wall biosynthesis
MRDERMVYFITSATFPHGGAGTARKFALAKGLIRLGYRVHIISTINYGSGDQNIKEVEGIQFHCSAPSYQWGGSMFRKLYHLVYGQASGLLFVLKDSKGYSSVAITTNLFNLYYLLPVWVIARVCKAFFFSELNENPLVTRNKESLIKSSARYIHVWLSLRLYDKVFVMTYGIKDLLATKYGMKGELIVLHNAVDLQRFPEIVAEVEKNTIGYAGSLSFRKDSLDILLRSISNVKDIIPNIRLRIACFSGDPYYQQFLSLVTELNLSGCIDMYYDLPNEDIPEFLSKSELLILIRIPNEQTSYGFPTKLVEYLASARPVIVSSVSDIPLFLTHMQDAYITDSTDEEVIAHAISLLLNNENLMRDIGNKGRQSCTVHFNNLVESKKIMDAHNMFLSSN